MQTHCSQCAAPMDCGASEKNCWCQALPSLPSAAYRAGEPCLCAACLHNQLVRSVIVYGIPNCDTVKKARAFLLEQGISYIFWDYKKHGVPQALLAAWLAQHGWQSVCNTRGPTWRKIPEALRLGVSDAASALPLLLIHASAIKRPIVSWGAAHAGQVTVGFNPALWLSVVA